MSGFGVKASVFAVGCAAVLAASVTAGLAQDRSAGVPGLKLSGDQPIQIESDKLEVDEVKAMATFTGNVNVVQGPTQLKAGRMVVYYKPANKDGNAKGGPPTSGSTSIDRMEVDGKVYVKSGTQVGTGDAGTFDVDSNVLTLSGREVVLSDGPNVLVGCKLTVNMATSKSDIAPCPGQRVKSMFRPNTNASQSN